MELKKLKPFTMKKTVTFFLFISACFALLFFTSLYGQDKPSAETKNILSDKEALSIFAANGDSMIIRPEHLGIINGMATVGISHNYMGVIAGLWGQPL
jgi:hypothetical protein